VLARVASQKTQRQDAARANQSSESLDGAGPDFSPLFWHQLYLDRFCKAIYRYNRIFFFYSSILIGTGIGRSVLTVLYVACRVPIDSTLERYM